MYSFLKKKHSFWLHEKTYVGLFCVLSFLTKLFLFCFKTTFCLFPSIFFFLIPSLNILSFCFGMCLGVPLWFCILYFPLLRVSRRRCTLAGRMKWSLELVGFCRTPGWLGMRAGGVAGRGRPSLRVFNETAPSDNLSLCAYVY